MNETVRGSLDTAPARAATALQTTASDPALSAWVAANAGSGKTHVLARRVIRLLLREVAPSRILCLTYTKAAAANMSIRVLNELREWVSLDDGALDARIAAADGIDGREPAAARRARARRLFAAALETPGGLKIQTIHAFCSALLHRFPFEAGVPAGFSDLDESARAELLARVREEVVLEAAGTPDGPLGRALATLLGFVSDGTLPALIGELIDQPAALDADAADIAAAVGCPPGVDVAGVEHAILNGTLLPRGAWLGLGQALLTEGGNCAKRGSALLEAAAAPLEGAADLYIGVFFKENGEPYGDSQFGRKEIVQARYSQLLAERDRLVPLVRDLFAARAAERSLAALVLAREARCRYEREKRARGTLDFADMISFARRLLGSGASAWVHYKLDQGIDHVLLDEAQDTSPEQWEVIRPLVAEFFAGEGASTRGRSLFVVGDEKQSIFSFQGADPRRFDSMRGEFARLVPAGSFAEVKLQHSFRSAPGILQAVDTVFRREEAFQGLNATPEPTHHQPIHVALPALVEIWEPEQPGESVDVNAWARPLDAPAEDDPVSRLARHIAGHVAARIAARFPVALRKETRPIRPGDVLVLVRRRGAIFESVIRELKQRGVPVAGADRLVVAQHIAVMDLMALGDALIAPDDELALACALKSPLFGFDDHDLMKLAPGRTRRLEAELRARADADPKWAAAAAALDRLRPEALSLRPFDFYTRVLGRERGRARMLARLGPEAADALDEMLTLARNYESVETPSLAGFLAFLRRAGTEAKRDMEAGRDEVRVMTVHGAKGLEAPYVILADTTTGPRSGSESGLLRSQTADGRPLLLLAGAKRNDTPAIAEARRRNEAAAMDEYRRLLYVALTRAETTLVVAGADGKKARPAECWYNLVRAALEPESVPAPATGFEGTVLRWPAGLPPPPAAAPPSASASPMVGDDDEAVLARLLRPIDDGGPPPPARPAEAVTGDISAATGVPPAGAGTGALAPSRAGAAGTLDDTRSAARAAALMRGDLVHRLLAGLAGLPEDERAAAGRRLLDGEAAGWSATQREEVLATALATLALTELAPLFGPGSRAEVPLAGEIAPGQAVSGRIDRLAVLPDRVLIADFKTDAQAPARPPVHHIAQVGLYARLLERLYPGRAVEAVLVYTAGPAVHLVGRMERNAAVDGVTSA
ncbi:double-strand break repair helicase AddA [Ancylobacter lacus]|uniref:double-strand break repair helicase AddA n=1 Tax=Ancylobacter lacus TaxID=2579970 RepID=UPI001BCD4EC3|nr:double-strand break repair helicase AddA [Ancylobacter lacus]MBS7540454.1 double-strand break repair helicase AddA [Ancylobacter lacus]